MSSNVDSVGGTATVDNTLTQRRRALLPARLRAHRAPRWWVEIAILVVLNLVYERLRNLVPSREGEAYNRGHKVLDLTERLTGDAELQFNHFVADHSAIAHIFNAYYTYLHLPVTAITLLWIFRVHKRHYRAARTVLVTTTVFGLIGFYLFPMAPPRLLGGAEFVDTLVKFGTWGSWSSPTVASQTNQFAAMPSLHCAWALWVGLCVFRIAQRRWLRVLGAAYPVMTFTVVVGTANHFILDGIAGAAVLAAAFAVQRVLFGQGAFSPAPLRDELFARPVEPVKASAELPLDASVEAPVTGRP